MPLMIPAALTNTPADLNQACWVINAADCPFREPLEEFWRTQGMQPRSTILAQDLSCRELVAQGLGIGFLEPQDGLTLIRKGQARWHGEFFLEVPLWVVYQDQALQADAEHLRRYVQQRYEALPPFTGGNCAN